MNECPTAVLLIEDNPGDARLIHFMLWETPGNVFSLDHASELSKGLERLAAGGVDVVLLDLHLPDSKGLNTFLKVYQQVPEIPIILLTGLDDESLAIEAVRRGAQDYLVKDQVEGPGLARAIRYAIERKHVDEELHRYAERLKTLREIDQAILTARSSEAIALAALNRIQYLVPCQRTSVIAIARREKTQVLAAEVNNSTRLKADIRGHLKVLDLQTLETGVVHGTENLASVKNPTPLQKLLYTEGVRSYILVPLVFYGELVGILSLEAERPYIFQADHIDIAKEVAASLAVAMRQARLHEQTRRDAETKSVLLREVNHRVKNNLSAIIGFLYAEQSRAELRDQPTYQNIIQELITRVQGLVTVHTLLSDSEWAPLSLSELAAQVVHSALDMMRPDHAIHVNVTPSPIYVTSDQAHHLALIINELATNSAKHALQNKHNVQIDVKISQENRQICLEFQDNGPGYPEEVLTLQHHNVGFDLIKNIVQRNLKGTLTLHNAEGAVATLYFKSQVEITNHEQET